MRRNGAKSHGAGRRRGRGLRASALCACLALAACGGLHGSAGSSFSDVRESDACREARADRSAHLEREVARLQTELERAEHAIATEPDAASGAQSRAKAVSSLAEARIAVERAQHMAPWRRTAVGRAQAKLDEADRQLRRNRPSAALFFASRAKRIADGVNQEALRVARSSSTRFVGAHRANLRASPSTDSPIVAIVAGGSPVFSEREKKGWVRVRTSSGRTGWMHQSVFASRGLSTPRQ